MKWLIILIVWFVVALVIALGFGRLVGGGYPDIDDLE